MHKYKIIFLKLLLKIANSCGKWGCLAKGIKKKTFQGHIYVSMDNIDVGQNRTQITKPQN